MLLVLPAKMNIFADNLVFDMSDFSFSWKMLLTLRYDVTMPYRSFSNSSNKVIYTYTYIHTHIYIYMYAYLYVFMFYCRNREITFES